jgi:hypothetical protein
MRELDFSHSGKEGFNWDVGVAIEWQSSCGVEKHLGPTVRSYFITGLEFGAAFPQGLKPAIFLLPGGMAEAMPFQNRVMKRLLLVVSASMLLRFGVRVLRL